jgi:hypothetical protein
MRYIIVLMFMILFLSSCDNTRQSIGITTKPLQSGEKFEDSTKLNWKITWGKIRSNKSGEED